MRAKLTKRMIDASVSGSTEIRVWDTEVKGFVLRIFPDGRRNFGVKYRIGARQRWFTIGNFGDPWTVDEARERAKRVLRSAEDGVDPQTAKQERRAALTVDELIECYLAEGPRSKPEKRSSSWRHDISRLRRHVSPLIGRIAARDVTHKDVERVQADVAAGKTQASIKGRKRGVARVRGGSTIASGVVRTLAAAMNWAVREGMIDKNPCVGVKRVATPRRERYLTREEVRRVLGAADELATAGEIPRAFSDAVRLLALTGARRSEILELRWPEVDLERGRVILPRHRSKTGEKSITLNRAAIEILRRQPRSGSEHVFPGRGIKGPLVGVSKRWDLVRRRAGIADLRMHDLRHTFASFAVADGASLYVVGKALGHTQASTTERYAHLADDPIRAVSEAVARQIVGE